MTTATSSAYFPIYCPSCTTPGYQAAEPHCKGRGHRFTRTCSWQRCTACKAVYDKDGKFFIPKE